MTPAFFRAAPVLVCLVLAPGCVISDGGDDDDGAGTDDPSDSASASASASATAATASASASDSASASATDASASATDASASASASDSASASASDSDSADTSGGDSGADVTPVEGLWQYEETAGATNDCTFLDHPSNGFGAFEIALTGPGTLTLTPGDETDPFDCTFGGGDFECEERLQGMTDQVPGLDAVGNILVAVDGTFASATSLSGTQHGHIDCEGADCATAATALGVTFPCSFTVPFDATAL